MHRHAVEDCPVEHQDGGLRRVAPQDRREQEAQRALPVLDEGVPDLGDLLAGGGTLGQDGQLHEPFVRLLEEVTARLAGADVPLRGEATAFRIHRDVRFHPDGSPYATHVSGLLTGTESESGGLVTRSRDVRPSVVEPVRQARVERPEALDRVLDSLHAADVVRLRSLVVTVPLHRDAWLDDDLPARVERFAHDVAPLLRFVDGT